MDVLELSGKTILTNNRDLTKGENTIQLETSRLSPGLYLLRLTIDSESVETIKFVKQ